MQMLNPINPNRLDPEELSKNLGPFGSWPSQGIPEGYFELPMIGEASDFYQENGWIVIHKALSEKRIQQILNETTRISRNSNGEIGGIEPAPAEMSDDDACRRVLCIHHPHKMSPLFKEALAFPELTSVLTQLIGNNVKAMQSMLFLKASGKPGQAWHQDEDFIPTRDRSLTGAWIALDDATVENGCLWVVSGSHKPGVLWPQKVHNDSRFDCTRESYNFPWQHEDSIPVEVKKGSIVFFNGYTLHRSLPNRAESGYRRSLVNHYMSAESFLPWRKPEHNSMAQADYRDIEVVAGVDPYAYKGTVELSHAHVRPDGQGGCDDQNDEPKKKLD
ncbi:MAG: phytanoyl-CoA dioxygenase family protein [Verrucomicrobiota bacterium]